MQAKKAEKLRASWGDKPCTHERASKEYDLGGQTGDYICETCGALFWGHDDWQQSKVKATEKYGGPQPPTGG